MTDTRVAVRDRCSATADNVLCIERTWTALEDIDSIRLTLDFIRPSGSDYAMIPAVCYNGNQWGKGMEPKGFRNTYSFRRTAIPGATYSEGDGYAVAMWSEVPSDDRQDFSCSILPEEGCTTHSIIVPEEELPKVYCSRDRYTDGYARRLSLRKGEQVSVKAYLCITRTEPDHRAVRHFLDAAWKLAPKSDAKVASAEELWKLGIRYAKESLWAEEGPYKGLSIGLVTAGDGWQQRPGWKYEIGWCGQNASFANSLLADWKRTGNEESLKKALAILDTWSSEAVVYPNGLYVTNYDYLLSGKENPSLDACNLGTVALQYLETADMLADAGLQGHDGTRQKEIALGILDFAVSDQLPSGCYAKGWRADGEAIYREGTVGAFLIAPMLKAYSLTAEDKYHSSAIAAYEYYIGEFNSLGYTTAGALDTWCIDKESAAPLLRAALALYETTSDQRYLDDAEALAYYITTWMWHYNSTFGPDSDFSIYGFDTFGATAVSVQHHHLDPYMVICVGDFFKLAELTGDCAWKEKGKALWKGGCQLVSDGTLEMHGRLRPAGSQNEAYLHCNWGWDGKPDSQRLNDWLVAWPGAFRLETLRHLSDWSDLD